MNNLFHRISYMISAVIIFSIFLPSSITTAAKARPKPRHKQMIHKVVKNPAANTSSPTPETAATSASPSPETTPQNKINPTQPTAVATETTAPVLEPVPVNTMPADSRTVASTREDEPPNELSDDPTINHGLGLSLAPKIGATVPTSKLSPTYYAALDVGYRLNGLQSLIGWPIGVNVEFAYVKPNYNNTVTSEVTGDINFKLEQQLLILAIEGFVEIPLVWRLKPYAGVGYGWYFLHANLQSLDQENGETQMRSGMQLRGGVGFTLGPGDLFAELRYHYVGLKFFTTGNANAGGITLASGYRFIF